MKRVLASIPTFNARDFSRIANEAGAVCAEASTIGYRTPGRIWNDAADMGIAIRNANTGNVSVFHFDKEDYHDGELVATRFRNINPRAAVRSVVIFND